MHGCRVHNGKDEGIVNPIKKLKLKAQLRNCDYVLAGTVIKQQYYDANKNSEINRMIDRLLANPGFEEALKLIEYNDIMIFYFTESCGDGLYIRKITQESKSVHSQAYPNAAQKENSPAYSPELKRKGTLKQVNEEPPEPAAKIKAALTVPDLPDARFHSILSSADIEPEVAAAVEEELFLPRPFASETAPAPAYAAIPKPAPAAAPKAAAAGAATPEPIPAAVSEAAQRPSFTNVVATLKIDIHTMVKELDEYRRQLSYYPANERELKQMIQALEAAVQEFSQAVDLLEGQNGS